MSKTTKTNWRTVRLGDVVDVYGGGTPATSSASYWNGSIPWLTPAELTGESDRFIENTKRMITDEGLKNSSARLMPEDSILLTSRATIGEVVINKKPMATNQGFINIDPKEIDKMFLFYWLRGNKMLLKQHATGSTFLEISKSVFKTLHISLPEKIDEQKRIGDVLSVFDEKIENNNCIIKTLEEMTQAIFKERFVKNAKGRNQKSKLLGNVVELIYGKALKQENRKTGDVVVVGSSGIVGKHDEKLVTGPGIVVGRKGVAGSVIWVDDDFYPIDTTFYVKTDLPMIFCYFMLKRANFIAGDSAVPGLGREDAYGVEVQVPDRSEMEKFQQLVEPMFLKRYFLWKENQKLVSMRDLLLPRLMSGEIQV